MTELQKSAWSWAQLGARASAPLLLCSLIVNVVLGSYLAVQAVVAEPQLPGLRSPQRVLAMLAQGLPQNDAEILWNAFRPREAEISAAEADAQQARARAMSILGRPDLDMGAFRAAAREMGEKRTRVKELFFDAMVDTMQHISPEARQKLVSEKLRPR